MNKILKKRLKIIKRKVKRYLNGIRLIDTDWEKAYQHYIDHGMKHLILGTTKEEIVESMKKQEAWYFSNDITLAMMGADD